MVPRRLLLLHSFYNPKTPSGENDFVKDQVTLLSESGYIVDSNFENTEIVNSNWFAFLFKSIRVRFALRKIVFRNYDYIIVHNIFPKIGIRKLLRTRVPTLRFIHNFKSICISGNLFRDGNHCQECISKGKYSGVRNRCYKKSFLLSLLITFFRTQENKLLAKANVTTIFLSDPSMRKITENVNVANPTVLSNFSKTFNSRLGVSKSDNGKCVYIGRLSHEKGILDLVRNWPSSLDLDIYGSGPLEDEIRKIKTNSNVEIKGRLPREELASVLKSYRVGIFPSLWGEISSIALRDYVGAGLPIIMLKNPLREGVFVETNAVVAIPTLSGSEILKGYEQIMENYALHQRAAIDLSRNALSQENWLKSFRNIIEK